MQDYNEPLLKKIYILYIKTRFLKNSDSDLYFIKYPYFQSHFPIHLQQFFEVDMEYALGIVFSHNLFSKFN